MLRVATLRCSTFVSRGLPLVFVIRICRDSGLSRGLLPFSQRASTGLWRAMATDADAAAEAMAGMASGATATGQLAPKRKRGTALQAAENKVTELTIALDVALAEEVQAKAKAVERKTKAAWPWPPYGSAPPTQTHFP